MNNNMNKFEENNKNVNVNEQQEVAPVENNEKSVIGKVVDVATNKYTLITAGTLAAGFAIWKWGIPAAKKMFGKKKEAQPATDSEGFENK